MRFIMLYKMVLTFGCVGEIIEYSTYRTLVTESTFLIEPVKYMNISMYSMNRTYGFDKYIYFLLEKALHPL